MPALTDDLLTRARAGDGEAFRALTEPHRRALRVHCYRMLGSFQDAEDAVQETMVGAWRGLSGFDGRASLRTWLYRVATNRCLNARRAILRRPAKAWDTPGVEQLEPTRLGEVVWLEPFPDALLEGSGANDDEVGPEARYQRGEALSLAFIAALQSLPPRQLAVLVLRDVLGFPSSEVAELLGASLDSVNSALKRARAGLERAPGHEATTASGSPEEAAVVASFVRAYESSDLDSLVAILTEDVSISMPPMPAQYQGRELVGRFMGRLFDGGRHFDLVATRANGQPAFGAYLRSAQGDRRGAGLFVIALRGDRIAAMTRFESHVLPWFGLPRALPAR